MDAYRVSSLPSLDNSELQDVVQCIVQLDQLHHAMLSNPVARRASKAQGSALFGLYARSFAAPMSYNRKQDALVSRLKRLALAPTSDFQGHLPIAWAVICSALDISLGKSYSGRLKDRLSYFTVPQKNLSTCISSCMPEPSFLQPFVSTLLVLISLIDN